MHTLFRDRAHAGRILAERLHATRDARPIVVGLAPGGVPVAYEVACALEAPLDAWAPDERRTLVRASEDHRHRPRLSLRNETVILVADVLTSDADVRAAVAAMRQEKPHRLILAVPVASSEVLTGLDRWLDGVTWLAVCEATEDASGAYGSFRPVSGAEVTRLLDRHRHELGPRWSSAS